MIYYLYEIKNKLNDKIYIGVHRTKTFNDGYMGSGKIIKKAIKKYGIENFTKTILETFDSSELMYAREKEIVNDEFLARDNVYNLRRGGFGGFDYVILSGNHVSNTNRGKKLTEDHVDKIVSTRKKRMKEGLYTEAKLKWAENAKNNNPMYKQEVKEKVRKSLTGLNKSEEHKKNISAAARATGCNKGRKYPNRKKREALETKIVECPHCKHTGGIYGMTRWHFDNCKQKQG